VELTFIGEQTLDDLGENPLLLHRPDNRAQIVYHTNDLLYYITGPTPLGTWTEVEFGNPILYERCAVDRMSLALAYESGYNGIFSWRSHSWGEEPYRHEMALLLERRRPAPLWLNLQVREDAELTTEVREDTELTTEVRDEEEIETEGVIQE